MPPVESSPHLITPGMSVPALPMGVTPGVLSCVALVLPAPHALSTSRVALIITNETRASHDRRRAVFETPMFRLTSLTHIKT